ncbi:MAG: hypothetical protein ACTHU7_03030 [Microbacterium sp.]
MPEQRSFTEFLDALLRFESAMDPALIIPELDRTDHRRSYFQLQKDEHGKVIPGHLSVTNIHSDTLRLNMSISNVENDHLDLLTVTRQAT